MPNNFRTFGTCLPRPPGIPVREIPGIYAYRIFNFFSSGIMVYVRPIVEYNSIIWSPSTAVESVQRRFTKRLPTL